MTLINSPFSLSPDTVVRVAILKERAHFSENPTAKYSAVTLDLAGLLVGFREYRMVRAVCRAILPYGGCAVKFDSTGALSALCNLVQAAQKASMALSGSTAKPWHSSGGRPLRSMALMDQAHGEARGA